MDNKYIESIKQMILRGLCSLMASILITGNALWADASIEALAATYTVQPDVVYQKSGGIELKLDIYMPYGNLYPAMKMTRTTPVLVYYHGGGWRIGSKDEVAFKVLPYIQKGWSAVAVQYRLSDQALAPAAVEDSRCALRWVVNNAEKYGFDTEHIVLSGQSAGGHLALMTGFAPVSAGFDNQCAGSEGWHTANVKIPKMKVAAIVNWSGVTDVTSLAVGEHKKAYAVQWFGALDNLEALAKRVSPVSHVRTGLPPVLTLHGDKDQVVPYRQAERLHNALQMAGVPNQLHTIKDRNHFIDFTIEDVKTGYKVIDAFIAKHLNNRQ